MVYAFFPVLWDLKNAMKFCIQIRKEFLVSYIIGYKQNIDLVEKKYLCSVRIPTYGIHFGYDR